MTTLLLDEIVVGTRDRDDMGDLTALADSMTEVGLLHPIVVTEGHDLVAGGRRLAAARSLGWYDIEVTVVTNLVTVKALLRAEADENSCREKLTPLEAARARSRRAAILAPAANERKLAGRVQPSAKLAEGEQQGETRKVAATGTGYSSSTLDKVDYIAERAADSEQPEMVRKAASEALDQLDSGSSVNAAHGFVTATERMAALHNRAEKRDNDPARIGEISDSHATGAAIEAAINQPGQIREDAVYLDKAWNALRLANRYLSYDAARLAQIDTSGKYADNVEQLARKTQTFLAQMRAKPTRLRAVKENS